MAKNHYNVFLNYRRKPGRDFARTLQQAFKARGYSVFFDYDSLQDGRFNEEIYSAIENCDVFISSYSLGSLDPCKNPGDWVRIEIEHALKHGKKIIPIAPTEIYYGWSFPRDLPASLGSLPNIQITEIHTGKYFDDSVDHCIQERFPKGMVRRNVQQTGTDTQEAEKLFREGRKHEYGAYERCDMGKALECYLAAAEMGHPDAQFEVGFAYSNGCEGRVRDMELAIEWWQKAAEGGSPDAMSALADLLERGERFEKDEARAGELYQKAFSIWKRRANAGDARAQCCLANCHENGKGTPVDHHLSVTWYRKAAENNDIWALLQLGVWGLWCDSMDEDERKKWREIAFPALKRLAEKGNPWCQSELAEIYSGTPGAEWKNVAESIKWLELAARQGIGQALHRLGERCLSGNGVPVDFGKSAALLAQAVQNGNRDALYGYGICLVLGFDRNVDYDDFDDVFRKVCGVFEKGAEAMGDWWEESHGMLELIRESSKRSGPAAAAARAKARCWIELSNAHADNGHPDIAEEDIRNAAWAIQRTNRQQFKGEDATAAAQLLCDYAARIVGGKAEQAQQCCQNALAIAEGAKQDTGDAAALKGSILVVLAKALGNGGQATAALHTIQEALECFDAIGKTDGSHDQKRAECWFVLGKLQAGQQQFGKAISSFQQAFSLFDKLSGKPVVLGGIDGTPAAEAALEIARCFAKLNNKHPACHWTQTALAHLPDPAKTQEFISRNNVRHFVASGWQTDGPDIEKMRKTRAACEQLLPKVRLFNYSSTDKVARMLNGTRAGNRLLAKTGWTERNSYCDLVAFDEVCTIPLILLPEKWSPVQGKKQNGDIFSTADCIDGNAVFPEKLVLLAEKSLDAIYPKRQESKQHCRCLIVCGNSTAADIRRLWGEWLEHGKRESGVKFCTYGELQTELARCFNLEPQESGLSDKVRYEIWIEALPFELPETIARMVGNAMHASGVGKSWNVVKSVFTMGKRIDFQNPDGNGILVQKLTREEAFGIRENLLKNGFLASARPMNAQ